VTSIFRVKEETSMKAAGVATCGVISQKMVEYVVYLTVLSEAETV
jgi:hypothetical protein